jgi:hypothetical protein
MTADCNPAGERDAVCEQTTVFVAKPRAKFLTVQKLDKQLLPFVQARGALEMISL